MGRRHPDVDDREIRLILAHEPEQLRAVTRLPHDLVSALLEQPRQALTHQDIVVGDDHSHSAHFLRLAHGESMHPASKRLILDTGGARAETLTPLRLVRRLLVHRPPV